LSSKFNKKDYENSLHKLGAWVQVTLTASVKILFFTFVHVYCFTNEFIDLKIGFLKWHLEIYWDWV